MTLSTPQETLEVCLNAASSLLKSGPNESHPELLGYTTEDIASEAYLKLLGKKVTKSYVTSTVRSVCADAAKKRTPDLQYSEITPENTEEFYDLLSLEDIAEDVLRNLHGGPKELFTALYVDQVPAESLAEHYGLSQRTITRKLYELRLILEDLLELTPAS